MKKLLIATTALVATTGVAVADVTFSGYGRFGILYQEDRSRTADAADVAAGRAAAVGDDVELEETRMESRYRLNIDSSTETDGGVRFAARIRVEANDNDNGGANQGVFSGARFQVNTGGFRVRVGNISGVHDSGSIVNFFGFEPGLIGQVGHYNTFGGGPIDAFSSTGAGSNGINVLYEAGDFAIMASYSEDLDENDGSTSTGDYEAFEIGVQYTVSGWTLGVAYGTADFTDGDVVDDGLGADADFWTATATGTLGAADVALFIGDSDYDDDDLAYGISGSFPVGASTDIVASIAGGGNDDLDTSYGIGFVHGLGGGVSLKGMVGRNTSENTVADLGVVFNF